MVANRASHMQKGLTCSTFHLVAVCAIFFAVLFFTPHQGACVKVTAGEEGTLKPVQLQKSDTVVMTPEAALNNGGNGVTPTQPGQSPQVEAQGELPLDLKGEELPVDPEAVAIEDRITRYKFILESLGFTLSEFTISPDEAYHVQLVFEGKMNSTQEKFDELNDKFPDESKLMGLLERVYEYNRRDLTNYAAYRVVLRLSEPLYIAVQYRKF